MSTKKDRRCCVCKNSECYGWHHWGCQLTGEVVDENDCCEGWEEDE